MMPPFIVDRFVLDDVESLPLSLDIVIGVAPSRSLSQDVEHAHAKNVDDLDLNDNIV